MTHEKRYVDVDPLPPIELIEPDLEIPRPQMTRRQMLEEVLKAAPNLLKLTIRLLRDPGVPRRNKLLVAAGGAYVISPIDVIPERLLPVVGRFDDLLVVAFVLDQLFDAVEYEVLQSYWDGEDDALELLTALVAWGADLMPRPVKRLLR